MKTARYGACSACRRSKVKCLARAEDPSSCQRCAELGESCEFEPHRKGRSRVHAKYRRPVESATGIAAPRSSTSETRMISSGGSGPHESSGQQWPPLRSSPYVVIHSMTGPRDWFVTSSKSIYAVPCPDQLRTSDPIDRGIITIKDAERLFKRWVRILKSPDFSDTHSRWHGGRCQSTQSSRLPR